MKDSATAGVADDFTARRALAKSISAIESGGAEALAIEQRALEQPAAAHVLGITGPPGAGKSSLISALLPHALAQYGAVAVLAIDPSSSLTGGALLGDRVRMDYRHFDQKVFFRSMASRGHQGGIAAATRASVNLLDAAGWPLVIIETLGIGQVELDIMTLADRVAVVLNPGWGDSFQANKAGLTEVGDVFVINKADKEGLNQTRVDLQDSLSLLSSTIAPVIAETVATTGQGIAELWQTIRSQTTAMTDAGLIDQRRSLRQSKLVEKALLRHLESKLKELLASETGKSVLSDIARGKLTLEEAYRKLVTKL